MNNTKLYVGNVPFDATHDDLREHFSRYGNVTEVFLPTDKTTGRPRGFAFVTMGSAAEARAARAGAHGAQFKGRRLAVAEARPAAVDRNGEEPSPVERPGEEPRSKPAPSPSSANNDPVIPALGASVDAPDQKPKIPDWRETFQWLLNPRQAIDRQAQYLMAGRFSFLIGIALLAVTIPMMISAPSVTPVLGFISGIGAACAALGRSQWPWLAMAARHRERDEAMLPPFREMPEQAPALPSPTKSHVIDVDVVEVRAARAQARLTTLTAKPDMPALPAPKANGNTHGRSGR